MQEIRVKIIKSVFVLTLFITGCKTKNNSVSDVVVNGVYIQKGDERRQLHFKDNNFVFLDKFMYQDFSYYEGWDTISKGIFRPANNSFIEVTSEEVYNSGILELKVKERKNDQSDTLFINIINPIEKRYNSKTKRELKYLVQLATNDKEINKVYTYNVFNQSSFKIPISNAFEIYEIELTVYIEPEIRIKEKNIDVVNTIYQKIIDKKSNVLEVDIPKLTYSYIGFKRLNKDYIRVVSRNKLIWDGNEFIK